MGAVQKGAGSAEASVWVQPQKTGGQERGGGLALLMRVGLSEGREAGRAGQVAELSRTSTCHLHLLSVM